MLQFLASWEPDCDGPYSRIYRVDVPSYMRDDEAMIFALEHGQMRYGVSDPTEWFTVPVELHPTVREWLRKTGSQDGTYCTVPGNIFNYGV
jgi:hypothetical protein